MFSKSIRIYLSCLFAICYTGSYAQEDYLAEIGVMGGGAYYLGDANTLPFLNAQPDYAGFFRYRFDDRTAAKVELNYTKIVGAQPDFTNNIGTMDFCGEFNFFDGTKSI